ncbi:hypothetical protein NQ314_001598 [Rhamnusium bicolor]|uniref:Peptidase A2 domain-containing protein n=1 Tax=Rhamnusium bicolor TaxID=1586634 RepID=A0AAV8ZRF5_9CUCU|nr:hypothetical protein NQ314_001598 [Rhamnusium bicolor]
MGNEVDKIFYNSNRKQEGFPTYDDLKAFFDSIYTKKTNVIYERAKFNQRDQREGETAEEYITELLKLVRNCKYGELSEELIRDRLVVGIKDRDLSERLQMDEELTMQKAIQRVQQAETVKKQNKAIRQEATINIEQVHHKAGKESRNKWKKGTREEGKNSRKDVQGVQENIITQYLNVPQLKTQRRIREVHETEEDSSCEELELEVGSICINDINKKGNQSSEEPWSIELMVANESVNFKIDTGADETVISVPTYKKIGGEAEAN